MRDAFGTVHHALRLLRAGTPVMVLLRVVMALGCACCLACCDSATAWTWILALVALAAVAMPDTMAPALFLGGTLVLWLALHRHPWQVALLLAASMALVHWSAIMCSRGPLQARVHRSAFAARPWLAWLGCSVLAVLLVLAVGSLGAHVPGGWLTMGMCLAVGFATLAVLLAASPGDH